MPVKQKIKKIYVLPNLDFEAREFQFHFRKQVIVLYVVVMNKFKMKWTVTTIYSNVSSENFGMYNQKYMVLWKNNFINSNNHNTSGCKKSKRPEDFRIS